MEQLFAEVKNYIDLKIKYYKLEAVEKLSLGVGKVLALLVFILLIGFAILLLTAALVILVAEWVNSYLWAFVIVGGFFALVAVLFLVLRESIFTNSMVRTFSKMFFPEKKEDEDDED